MKVSIKERLIVGLIILAAMLSAAAIGSFYLPAGIAVGAVALALSGLLLDEIPEEQQAYRTSPSLLPAVGLIFVAGITCVYMLVDFISWLMS